MKKLLMWSIVVGLGLIGMSADLSAARELAERVLGPQCAARIVFQSGTESSYAPADDGRIAITASNSGDAAMTLGAYLREVAEAHWGWCGARFPKALPAPKQRRVVKRQGEIAFAYNYCVHAYTFAFQGEQSWRAEIDRLALFGFNRALVVQGLAKVWQGVMREMGVPENQIRSTICDAAAAPFWHMGNVEGLGAPVADEVIERDAKLGAFMVREMRRLGIEPVLQGYVGVLPHLVAKEPAKYGLDHARVLKQGMWCGFERPPILDPTDVQFARIAEIWYRQLFKVYGTNYAAAFAGDLFHEGGLSGRVDVASAYRAVQREQQRVSPGVVWALMAWGNNPTPAMLEGMDPRFTLIERLEADMSLKGMEPKDYGKFKSIWCEILNFGGRTALYGGMDLVDALPLMGSGWGLHSEGQETNPWFYEEFTRKITGGAVDTTAAYARRRYGVDDARLVKALDLLRGSICASKAKRQDGPNGYGPVACLYPDWHSDRHYAAIRRLNYDTSEVVRARDLYRQVASARPELMELETFRYDFVDVSRQVLSDRMLLLFPILKTVPSARSEFLRLMEELDELLAQCPYFRLDTFEKRACELDPKRGPEGVRRMMTTWGEHPWSRGCLEEYANRMYSGLIRDYYLPRWKLFFKEGRHTEAFRRQERELTRKFVYGHSDLSVCAFPGKRLSDLERTELTARMTGSCIGGNDSRARSGKKFMVGSGHQRALYTCFTAEDHGYTKGVVVKFTERKDGVWMDQLSGRYVEGVGKSVDFLEVTSEGKCVYRGTPMAIAFGERDYGYTLRDFAIAK